MTKSFIQTELFGQTQTKSSSDQPQVKPAGKPFIPPHLALLNNNEARQNAVYALRVLINNAIKKLALQPSLSDKRAFLALLANELKIKRGITDSALAGRDGAISSFKK